MNLSESLSQESIAVIDKKHGLMESFDHNRYFENRNTLRVTVDLTKSIQKVFFYLIDLEMLANGTKDQTKY